MEKTTPPPLFTWRFVDALLLLFWGGIINFAILFAIIDLLPTYIKDYSPFHPNHIIIAIIALSVYRVGVAYKMDFFWTFPIFYTFWVGMMMYVAKQKNTTIYFDATVYAFLSCLAFLPGRWIWRKWIKTKPKKTPGETISWKFETQSSPKQ